MSSEFGVKYVVQGNTFVVCACNLTAYLGLVMTLAFLGCVNLYMSHSSWKCEAFVTPPRHTCGLSVRAHACTAISVRKNTSWCRGSKRVIYYLLIILIICSPSGNVVIIASDFIYLFYLFVDMYFLVMI